MFFEVVLGLVTLVLVLWWFLSPSTRLKQLGDKIPGPKPQPFVGNSLQLSILGPKAMDGLTGLMRKYGKTFRVWLGPRLFVFMTELEDIQLVFTSQSIISKSSTYKLLENWLGTGLLLTTGDLWQRRRKAITPAFHFKILDDFVPVFNKCADILVNCLSDKKEKVIDIEPFVSNAALDVITQSAMGKDVNAQKNPNNEYVESILRMTKNTAAKINKPWLAYEPFYTLMGLKSDDDKNLKYLKSLPKEVLENKKLEHQLKKTDVADADLNEFGMKKRLPFLERLIDIQRSNGAAFRNDQDILDEVTTFMFEGHDTTTASLAFTIHVLGTHPEIQENVYKEVSSIISDENYLKIGDLQELKYLERVIKESLRLYPPVPVIGRHLEKETTFPSGYTFPAGTELRIPIFMIQRHPDYFPDPEKFDPDRFLDEQINPYVFVPFSAGPRNCIGQKFAMLELKALLSKLVYNYKITCSDDVKRSSELVLRAIGGVKTTLIKRNN